MLVFYNFFLLHMLLNASSLFERQKWLEYHQIQLQKYLKMLKITFQQLQAILANNLIVLISIFMHIQFRIYKLIEKSSHPLFNPLTLMQENSSSQMTKAKFYNRPIRTSKMPQPIYSGQQNNTIENPIDLQQNQNRNNKKHVTAFGFEKADYDLALMRKRENSNLYYKGEQVPFMVDREHFKIYGPGVYLFFEFMWKLSLLFLVLAGISLIPTFYNYLQGDRFENSTDSLSIYVARTSIANFYGADPTKTTTQQVDSTFVPKLVNCISDLLCCFIFMIFYFYWTVQSSKRTEQLKKTIKLANYYTIELLEFPQDCANHQIYQFFSKFGHVSQVAPVRNYSETIQLSKEIYQLEVNIKQLRLQEQQCSNIDNSRQIQKYQKKMDKLYKELEKELKKSKEEIIKYYVSFQTPYERAMTVKRFSKVYTRCLCCSKVPQDYLLKGQKVKIQPCHNQPGQILWQNAHITWKTRWMRALAQMFLLLLFIAAGFFIIATLNILTPPSQTGSIDTSHHDQTTINSQTDVAIIQSWCLKNQALAYSTTATTTLCDDYITRYYYNLLLTYSITLVVVLVKFILKHLVIFIAKFQRYKEHTEQSIDIVKNLVIIYIITTIIIGFLLQANLFGIPFKKLIPDFLGNETLKQNAQQLDDYSTLSNFWYVDIGYQIWLTWLLLAFSPHIAMPIYHYGMECFNDWLAKRQKLQKNMEKTLQGEEFQIQDHYANTIMVFLVGMAFSGGMPIMLVLSFFGIITRYIYFKWIFIRFSKVPKTIDQALNDTVLTYFPWALGIHFAMTIWMYSQKQIFAFEQNFISQWYKSANTSIIAFLSNILGMIAASYYYSLVAAAMMLFIFLKETVYDFFTSICKGQSDSLQALQNTDTNLNNVIGNMKSQRGITSSYRIQNNPDYFEILSIKEKMQKRQDDQKMGLPQDGDIQM